MGSPDNYKSGKPELPSAFLPSCMCICMFKCPRLSQLCTLLQVSGDSVRNVESGEASHCRRIRACPPTEVHPGTQLPLPLVFPELRYNRLYLSCRSMPWILLGPRSSCHIPMLFNETFSFLEQNARPFSPMAVPPLLRRSPHSPILAEYVANVKDDSFHRLGRGRTRSSDCSYPASL
jgi:hypothetical protein